ncbi:MAG: efflux RND transporter periplasmic adaptor subunit [Anaerolineaceae bacterium]
MKSKKKTFIVLGVILIVIVLILVISGINRAKNAAQSAFQTSPLVRGNLTAIVGATGTVHANQSAILSWQTTGRIGKVNVKLDDLVTTDQILAELSADSLPQSIILAEADLVSAKRALDDLKNSDVASATAYQNMVLAQKAVDDARDDLDSKNYARADQETLDIARANLVIAEDAVSRAEQLYDQVDSLEEDNPIRAEAFSELAKAKQNRDRLQANLNWLLGLPDEQELATANAALDVALARLDDATREWERLKDGPDPEDVKAAEARVSALEATLKMRYVEAPFSGTITNLGSKTGDQVNPGTVAFQIDDLSQLLVDVDIAEVDINSIKIGQSATITFDAIQTKSYDGKVVEVARIGTAGQGVVNFKVTIALSDPDELVLPGMTAAVNIIVHQLDNVLLIPNRAVRLLEGNRVVYVLQNNTAVPVNIELGASSDIDSELVSGDLKEGDLIILNPPANITRGPMFGQ